MMQGGVLLIGRAIRPDWRARPLAVPRSAQARWRGRGGRLRDRHADTVREVGRRRAVSSFKFKIAKIVERNEFPGYALALETPGGKREPSLRMQRRSDAERP
jgi:hypothetical protein